MAAQEVKLETEVELKCSADEYSKRLTSDDMHHFTIASPDKVHAIEIHGDDCGGIRGSVKICTYTAGTWYRIHTHKDIIFLKARK